MPNNKFYIAENTLRVRPNDFDDPNMVNMSTFGICTITYYDKRDGVIQVGTPANKFPTWNVIALNIKFSFPLSSDVYLYLSLPREGVTAYTILSDVRKEDAQGRPLFDGQNFYVYVGKLTAVENSKRTFIPDFGVKSTDNGGFITDGSSTNLNDMFALVKPESQDPSTWYVEALRDLLHLVMRGNLKLGGQLVWKGKEFTSVVDTSTEGGGYTDHQLITALKVMRAIEENNRLADERYLRKDQPDQTNYLLKIGEFIDSLLAGKGTGLFPDGRIQTDRMEIRQSLTVMETIFNRLSAQEGDFSFSECGTIENVEYLSDGTYRLPLRKRWERDFTALDWNDIIYGSVNDLASGGGNIRTSWMRVIGVNTTENYIEAILYPDNEVPGGKNYPPEPLMAVTRRGNSSNEARQSYWYISSYEKCICMLDGVTRPILEESNYSVLIGKMKNLSIFNNLPINYRQSYIFVRGLIGQDIIRVDVTGKPISTMTDRGVWSIVVAQGPNPYFFETKNPLTGAQETSTVYHRGVKWQCLRSGTVLEPKWNSTDWAFLEGNGEFSILFDSSRGMSFFYGIVDTVVTARFFYGEIDITDDVMSVPGTTITWSRDTGTPEEDAAWMPFFAEGMKNKLHLVDKDMGSSWPAVPMVTFQINAIIPQGDNNYLRESASFSTV